MNGGALEREGERERESKLHRLHGRGVALKIKRKMPTRHEYFSLSTIYKDFFRKRKTMAVKYNRAHTHTCTRIKNCKRRKKDFSLKGFVLHFVCLSRVY
jgi:hypothetical protein